jgi:N-acetylglucosaminyl-diphospho-decaprenol L-rhamnosyltransferase
VESSVVPVDIAFITVNYNTLECVSQLTSFFQSLRPDAPFTFTFTVVDNDSRDGSQEFLQSHPEINYLQTGGNIGYGRAINRGVAATASTYVCAMNTDVILNREALIELWRFLEERHDAGVCAPRITYEDGRDQGMAFQRSLFSHYANWFAKLLARYSKLKIAKAAAPLRVDGVLGAFFLIGRSVIPPPALFDEDFFFFYEDTALAHTLLNRGVPCFILPDATIVHIGGKSRSADSISFFYDSKYLYLKKFYGPLHANAIYFLDRARILRKWSFYSLFSLVTASERIKSKRRYYKIAWDTPRLR